MEPNQIEKFIGITLIVLAIATLLFVLQFTMNIAVPNILTIAIFMLLFLLSLITGIFVLKGGQQ